MLTRVKTGLIYGLIIIGLLIAGYFLPVGNAILLILITGFSSKEMVKALSKRSLMVNQRIMTMTCSSFIVPYIWYFIKKPELISAQDLVNNRNKAAFQLSLNKEFLLQVFLIYILALLITLGYATFKFLFKEGASSLPTIAGQILGGLYISLPVFFAFVLGVLVPAGWFWLVLAIVTPWVADSAAYFAGSAWGKKPIVPNLSPKKTVVGFWGSVVGTIIFHIPIFYFAARYLFLIEIKPIYWLYVIVFAGILGALIELGDWLASAIKRYCGIKDFSNLLPGHGGVIDRFDSTFFSITAILTIVLLVYIF